MAHWTDDHIHAENGEWIAYNEAGLEQGRYETKDKARDALVVYEAIYLSNSGRRFQLDAKVKLLQGMISCGIRHWFKDDLEGLKGHLCMKIEDLRDKS